MDFNLKLSPTTGGRRDWRAGGGFWSRQGWAGGALPPPLVCLCWGWNFLPCSLGVPFFGGGGGQFEERGQRKDQIIFQGRGEKVGCTPC